MNEDVNFCDRYVVCNTDYSDSVNVEVPDHVFLTFAIVAGSIPINFACTSNGRQLIYLAGTQNTWHMKHGGSVQTLFQ